MSETSESEIEIDFSKYLPTDEQIQIALNNCRLIYDPKNVMDKQMLYEYLDNGCLEYGKITLMSFIINTVEEIMKHVEDKKEGEVMVKMCCDYFNSPYHEQDHRQLSARIFEVVLTPIPLFENSAFVQVWCDIVEISFRFKEYERECITNNFDPYSFPNNITL